jgi:S1-C subfamily serine protease
MEKLLLKTLRTGVCFIEIDRKYPVNLSRPGQYFGSGFILNSKGKKNKIVCTCAHVISQNVSSVFIEFTNGFRSSAKVLYSDPIHDVAFVEFEDVENLFDMDDYQTCYNLEPFDDVTLIGCNEGYKAFVSTGIVADTNSLLAPRHSKGFQTSIQTAGGTSGSPIFNEQGKIVGMHTSGTERCSFEISIQIIEMIYQRFINNLPNKELGITLSYNNMFKVLSANHITPQMAELYFLNCPNVLYITDIDHSYHASGILYPGDIILNVNQQRVLSPIDFEVAINKNEGHEHSLHIIRYGMEIEVSVNSRCASIEITSKILEVNDAYFENITIKTRRFLGFNVDGIYFTYAPETSPFSSLGSTSTLYPNRKGVLITKLNGVPIKSVDDFFHLLNELNGTILTLNFIDFLDCGPERVEIIELKDKEIKEIIFTKYYLQLIAA